MEIWLPVNDKCEKAKKSSMQKVYKQYIFNVAKSKMCTQYNGVNIFMISIAVTFF